MTILFHDTNCHYSPEKGSFITAGKVYFGHILVASFLSQAGVRSCEFELHSSFEIDLEDKAGGIPTQEAIEYVITEVGGIPTQEAIEYVITEVGAIPSSETRIG